MAHYSGSSLINRIFEEAYPLLGPLVADSVVTLWSDVPNLRSSKRVQTHPQPALLPKPYQPQHSRASLREGLCSPNPYLRMRGIVTTPAPPLFFARIRITLLRLLCVARVRSDGKVSQ
ncbi:hypothetical protein M758_2G213800 [Ceratodon purpureus]|nr:hypothetical protein M758_2G213800 [Ceratodon purpureus]